MSNWIWGFLKRREADPERAAGRYLAWEFLFSVEGMAEHLAYAKALKRTEDASRSVLTYGGPGLYYTVTDLSVEPNPAFEKRATRRRSRYKQTHIRHLKRRLARFRRHPVPDACRTFAHYREQALEIEIYCLELDIYRQESREYVPQLDLWEVLGERLDAQQRAQTEILRLREQYRDSFSEELKSVRGRCERKMTGMIRNWRF